MNQTIAKDLLQVLFGPITRSRANKLKTTFNKLIHNIWSKVNFKEATSIYERGLIHLLHD